MAIMTSSMFYSLCYLFRKVSILVHDREHFFFLHNKELGKDVIFSFNPFFDSFWFMNKTSLPQLHVITEPCVK